MLTRRMLAIGSALAAALALGAGPAGAGDDAGAGGGFLWGSADEGSVGEDTGDDSGSDSGSDLTGESDLSGGDTASTGGSGDDCEGTSEVNSFWLDLLGIGPDLNFLCGGVPGIDDGSPDVVVIDAREAAEQAFDRLALETANIRMAPGPPLPTYPNLETWIWVPQSQWQPLTLSVTAGATTVHVEARPVRIDVDSGERSQLKYSASTIDSTFSCSGPGRAWRESLGDGAETSCGYTYMTTSSGNPAGGDVYDLTGAIVYEGSWTCVGQCTEDGGSLGEVSGPTSSQEVSVQERQSVVVD